MDCTSRGTTTNVNLNNAIQGNDTKSCKRSFFSPAARKEGGKPLSKQFSYREGTHDIHFVPDPMTASEKNVYGRRGGKEYHHQSTIETCNHCFFVPIEGEKEECYNYTSSSRQKNHLSSSSSPLIDSSFSFCV